MKHIKAALITGIIFLVLYLVAIFIDYLSVHYMQITLKVLLALVYILAIIIVYLNVYYAVKNKNKTEK